MRKLHLYIETGKLYHSSSTCKRRPFQVVNSCVEILQTLQHHSLHPQGIAERRVSVLTTLIRLSKLGDAKALSNIMFGSVEVMW